MKNTVTLLLILLFGSLLISTASARTDQSTLAAWAVLEHNKRLLDGTTIGYTLKQTTNPKAEKLFAEARELYNKAVDAYRSGQDDSAINLSFESIHTIYSSDRLHYNLADN